MRASTGSRRAGTADTVTPVSYQEKEAGIDFPAFIC